MSRSWAGVSLREGGHFTKFGQGAKNAAINLTALPDALGPAGPKASSYGRTERPSAYRFAIPPLAGSGTGQRSLVDPERPSAALLRLSLD